MLLNVYNESSNFDNTTIKADIEELYQLPNGKPLKGINEIIYAGCTLCRGHERLAGVEGVKFGIRLAEEIEKKVCMRETVCGCLRFFRRKYYDDTYCMLTYCLNLV